MTADFLRNLFEWAKADLAAEVASGFAALRRLRSVALLAFFEVYGRLGEAGRRALLDGLLKRAHPHAATLTAAVAVGAGGDGARLPAARRRAGRRGRDRDVRGAAGDDVAAADWTRA